MKRSASRLLPGLLAAFAAIAFVASDAFAQSADSALTTTSPEGMALIERLRDGGAVLFLRHTDTGGEFCDSAYRSIGEREGQRNISPAGRAQAVAIGEEMEKLGIPIETPVLAGPVFRARDTAELAFGASNVLVTDSLLADDYAEGRLDWVLSEHRRLFSEAPPPGTNRVLVGHRGPAEMIVGNVVSGTRLPEGGVMVLNPEGASDFSILGILEFVSPPGDGNPPCVPR